MLQLDSGSCIVRLAQVAAALAVVVAPIDVASQDRCTTLLPEITEPLGVGALPGNTSRWQAAERIWHDARAGTRALVTRQLSENGLSPAADTIQGFTNDLLREAIAHNRAELVEDLLEFWTMPLDKLAKRDRIKAYYADGRTRISEINLDETSELWMSREGIETVLHSAIFLAGAMDIVEAIARLPAAERTERMNAFAPRVSAVALSHVERWLFAQPGLWEVRGWGCAGFGMTLVDFTSRRLERSLGTPAAPYCDAPTDLDALISIATMKLLSVSKQAPEYVSLDRQRTARLLEFVRLQGRLFASRFVPRQAVDRSGRIVSTMDFDPGAWSLHPDFAYAADEKEAFPQTKPGPKPGVGWDFGHAARIAWVVDTFASSPELISDGVDWTSIRSGFARQIAYHVVAGDPDLPLFRNYIDGSNGWYRVSYLTRKDTGTPPYGQSQAYFIGSWVRQGEHEPILRSVASGAWRLLTAATPTHCRHLERYYIEGAYWMDRKPYAMPLTAPSRSIIILPFLALAPVN